MNLTNFHSHCTYCDGKAPAAEFVEAAIAAGFTSYGVSSHAPLPFETRWTMRRDRVDNYLAEINGLKETYKDRIELYVGMEIDYLDETSNPASPYFQALPLDYRIGSVHLLYTPDNEIVDVDTSVENFVVLLNTCFAGNLRQLVTLYFDTSMRMVEAGGFDFVGHCDKIYNNAALVNPAIVDELWFNQKIAEYFACISDKKIMLEVNTKAYAKKGIFFPNPRYFSLLRELNIPVIVNSDAHRPDLINSGRKEALQLLKQSGIATVMELHGGQWQETEINLL